MSDLIFGMTLEQVQLAQQGKAFREHVPTDIPELPGPTEKDLSLLAEHGIDGLKEMQLFGVIDRLSRD